MPWQAEQIVSLLRQQRHDFVNYLQGISGYIQLHKSDEALSYLKKVLNRTEQLGKIMRLKKSDLAVISLMKIKNAESKGINLEIEVNTIMENLTLKDSVLTLLWETAWDLAITMAGEGNSLRANIDNHDIGYSLKFKANNPVEVLPGEESSLTQLAKQYNVPLNWQPANGELSLFFI